MITIRKDKCIPEKRKIGDNTPPNYICLPNGNKYYLSLEDKKDYLFGGKCPQLCPVKNIIGNPCPQMEGITDRIVAQNQCEANPKCQFLDNSLFDRYGPNYCVPKKQPGCITLTQSDLGLSDQELTDSPNFCNRLDKGCIFNRGNGDGEKTRSGEPTCLRGCLGSKYWKNPKYMWGGGQTPKDQYKGSWFNSDLELGPIYLEASPSPKNPQGWGGPQGSPMFGNGRLPKSLGLPYTQTRGRYSPPCNINEGDIGVFTSPVTGELLAGPGCRLTPPDPMYGLLDWAYTCKCKYLGGVGEIKTNAWEPCQSWELDENQMLDRDVCDGCYIQDDKTSRLYGHCVLGNKTQDTESKILGCIPTPSDPNSDQDPLAQRAPNKCRVRRTIEPTECPSYCSNNPKDPFGWRSNTQCSLSLGRGNWRPNPEYNKVISLSEQSKQAAPYIPGNGKYIKKNTDYLCRNCSQTVVRSTGSGTKYPSRSYCLVGGNDSAIAVSGAGYSKDILRQLSCPPTCNQCMSGYFGQPMDPVYNFRESQNDSSAFSKGIIFVPSLVQ